MLQPQFKIESYDYDGKEITVMLEKYNLAIPITIPQDKFEWWLRLEDKLSWCMDTSDHQGQHQQFFGDMSVDEYWGTDGHYIKQDLYEYITGHPIKRDGVVFTNSLQSILLAFDIHNAQRPVELMQRWEHEQPIFDNQNLLQ